MIEVSVEDNSKYKFYINNVGYIIVEDTIDTINIIDVFINEDYRHLGYASKILLYIINYYNNRNIRYMLEVRVDNTNAIKLYEKFNFKVIYVRKKYYDGVDALIMERR